MVIETISILIKLWLIFTYEQKDKILKTESTKGIIVSFIIEMEDRLSSRNVWRTQIDTGAGSYTRSYLSRSDVCLC